MDFISCVARPHLIQKMDVHPLGTTRTTVTALRGRFCLGVAQGKSASLGTRKPLVRFQSPRPIFPLTPRLLCGKRHVRGLPRRVDMEASCLAAVESPRRGNNWRPRPAISDFRFSWALISPWVFRSCRCHSHRKWSKRMNYLN